MRHETFFDAGKLIVVQATIVGPRGTTTARMLLDTGATMTTVSPEILDLAGYNPRDGGRRTRVHSAVGEEHGYELPLAAFTALGFTLDDHVVNVFDLGHEDIADGRNQAKRAGAQPPVPRPESGYGSTRPSTIRRPPRCSSA